METSAPKLVAMLRERAVAASIAALSAGGSLIAEERGDRGASGGVMASTFSQFMGTTVVGSSKETSKRCRVRVMEALDTP
ncbi:MAG: hypothetical protein KDJ45_16595 [Hyphomicrobiaceae bacterium]|nr:hypothetical protein [Hyphomicrobiaceae bacterium]MCC0009022.1 hypothetical protein [Hyphomicrobiaceae bacterium]